MEATHHLCVCIGLVALMLVILSSALAEECIIPKLYPHFLSNDMQDVDKNLCYKCYHAPNSPKFQVKLHKIRLGGVSTMMIYIDGAQRHITQDCGTCDSHTNAKSETMNSIKDESKSDKSVCQECETLTNGTMVELYLRLSAQAHTASEGGNVCQSIADFNISLDMNSEKPDFEAPSDCDDGFLVSYPLSGDTCIINSTFIGTETYCLVPTCSDGIISSDETNEKIEHKFQPYTQSEACVWQLNTEQHKHVSLRFSQNIKPHITIFEESLMNPKWDVEWCPTYNNDFRMVTDADTVFIVYHSVTKLTKKGTLSITTQTDLCLLPPSLENGSVEFKRLQSGTVALYMCDKGFTLLGPIELHCKNGAWDEPPVCLHLHKDKLMSDAPMGSIESVDSVNVSVLTSENGSFLAASTSTDPQGKMPTLLFPEDDIMEDSIVEEESSVQESMTAAEAPIIEDVYMNKSLTNMDTQGNNSTDSLAINSTDFLGTDLNAGEEGGILARLFNFSLEDDMTLYIIIGTTGLTGLIIVLIISLIIYRKRYPVRLGLGRKFDTFQNPIYEKTVVRMPMQAEDTDVEGKKSDAEEMSDCTVLE